MQGEDAGAGAGDKPSSESDLCSYKNLIARELQGSTCERCAPHRGETPRFSAGKGPRKQDGFLYFALRVGLAFLSREEPVTAPLLHSAEETFASAPLLRIVNVSQLTATVKETPRFTLQQLDGEPGETMAMLRPVSPF